MKNMNKFIREPQSEVDFLPMNMSNFLELKVVME